MVTIPVFLPEESQGQRILAGYSPQGRKESDMTKTTQHIDSVTTHDTPPRKCVILFIPGSSKGLLAVASFSELVRLT